MKISFQYQRLLATAQTKDDGQCRDFVMLSLGLLVWLCVCQPALAGPLAATIFSPGPLFRTPETISRVPEGFGDFAEQFFVPDFNRSQPNGNIWVVPTAGGPPAAFASI